MLDERDTLDRDKKQLQLKVERTLRCIGNELSRLGREAENRNGRRPDEDLCIAFDSTVWRLIDDELPDLHNKLSKVVAEIEGIDYLQALAKVHAWQRPLVQRLVRPGLTRLFGEEVQIMDPENATVDASGREDN